MDSWASKVEVDITAAIQVLALVRCLDLSTLLSVGKKVTTRRDALHVACVQHKGPLIRQSQIWLKLVSRIEHEHLNYFFTYPDHKSLSPRTRTEDYIRRKTLLRPEQMPLELPRNRHLFQSFLLQLVLSIDTVVASLLKMPTST